MTKKSTQNMELSRVVDEAIDANATIIGLVEAQRIFAQEMIGFKETQASFGKEMIGFKRIQASFGEQLHNHGLRAEATDDKIDQILEIVLETQKDWRKVDGIEKTIDDHETRLDVLEVSLKKSQISQS